jgi:hypothetical protein
LWQAVLEQGGYAPTPPTATVEDQLFMVRVSVDLICHLIPRSGGGLDTQASCLSYYQRLERGYLADSAGSGPTMAYRQWLRKHAANAF